MLKKRVQIIGLSTSQPSVPNSVGKTVWSRGGTQVPNTRRVQITRGIKESESSLVNWIFIPVDFKITYKIWWVEICRGRQWMCYSIAPWNDWERDLWMTWGEVEEDTARQSIALFVCVFAFISINECYSRITKIKQIKCRPTPSPFSHLVIGDIIFWDNAIFLNLPWSF